MVKIEETPIKSGQLEKRSQNRWFYTIENYATRLFVLLPKFLKYYSFNDNSTSLKREIDLEFVINVDPVRDFALKGKTNIFQIVYSENLKEEIIFLYCIASSNNARNGWISAIREEAEKNGATLSQQFHDGVWSSSDGKYTCCDQKKGSSGCKNRSELQSGKVSAEDEEEILTDIMLKRAQGKSTFFPKENYKKRKFSLGADYLSYYEGGVISEKNLKGRIQLSNVVICEPVNTEEESKYQNMFQVVYDDDNELIYLYIVANSEADIDKWVNAIKKKCVRRKAELLASYHPCIWKRNISKWPCCNGRDKNLSGCCEVSDRNTPDVDRTTKKDSSSDSQIVKISEMCKRSQNKSTFFISNNYQQRVFMLDKQSLTFYKGHPNKGGQLKGKIPLRNMTVVEEVHNEMLEGKRNVFQIGYTEEGSFFYLYVVANTDIERSAWVKVLKQEAETSGVILQQNYHKGVWLKANRHYNCCQQIAQEAPGCVERMDLEIEEEISSWMIHNH